ncbi:hypothetical protein [uncultured Bacteroides sp.]|uniref:hypothetical protein n=1 Tax=uncultured Bacteroides sp. TaxID=162156 RepID=UPI0025F880A1|nr:hypothetical protein [uncultured Bacteroides sp.]
MFKHKFAIMFFLIIGILPITAQEKEIYKSKKEKQKIESLQRPFIMSFSIGPNFNTGGNDYSEWFGSRANIATQFDWRMNVSFARHWCAYLDLGITFFKLQTNDLGENIATALIDKLLFPGLSKIKPSISTGITYIAEKGRWQFMPKAGIGWMSAGYSNKTKTIDGKEYQLEIDRSPMFFNAGASIGYRTSNLCSVILDINYRCPIQSCKATYTTTSLDLPPVIETMKSHSWANDLSISLGIQLQLEMKKKK